MLNNPFQIMTFNPNCETEHLGTVLAKYAGKYARVIRELDGKDPELGRMFEIKFSDGTKMNAFADELTELGTE